MKNLLIHPENLYLIDTKTVLESTAISINGKWSPNTYVTVMPRRNVGVIKKKNHFFELEKIRANGLILPKPISSSFKVEEFINRNSIHKFPYPKDFDFEKATLESLRSVYRKYLWEKEDTIMKTERIKNLYVGNILKCNYQTPGYINTEKYLENVLLFQLENQKFMMLEDFLAGKNLFYSLEQREGKYFIDSCSLQEKSLIEAKNLELIKNHK